LILVGPSSFSIRRSNRSSIYPYDNGFSSLLVVLALFASFFRWIVSCIVCHIAILILLNKCRMSLLNRTRHRPKMNQKLPYQMSQTKHAVAAGAQRCPCPRSVKYGCVTCVFYSQPPTISSALGCYLVCRWASNPMMDSLATPRQSFATQSTVTLISTSRPSNATTLVAPPRSSNVTTITTNGAGKRLARAKETQFLMKHGHKHHSFDAEKAPYPVSYDRHIIEMLVQSGIF
jgi:hypothetical protein